MLLNLLNQFIYLVKCEMCEKSGLTRRMFPYSKKQNLLEYMILIEIISLFEKY